MAIRLRPLCGLHALGNNGPRLLFADHHERIEAGCRALLATMQAHDPDVVVGDLRTFERKLLGHLADEEKVILPAYEHYHPGKAQLIRDDHARIRQLLSGLDVEVEAHALRRESLKALLDKLREHSAREHAHMYPWAQVHLPLRTKDTFVVRLTRWVRSVPVPLRRKQTRAEERLRSDSWRDIADGIRGAARMMVAFITPRRARSH